MRYGLQLLTGPSAEPLSLAEAKAWLRQDLGEDDALIEGLVKAARVRAELETGRALITQTLELSLDGFPTCEDWESIFEGTVIHLPRPRLQSVASITYLDLDGETQTLAPDRYSVDARGEPGRVCPAYGDSWPTALWDLGAVVITYVAGYGDAAAAVPETIRTAMKLMLAHWYEHREEVNIGNIVTPIPLGAKSLLEGEWVGGHS